MILDYIYDKGITYYYSKNKKNLAAYFCMWKEYERTKLFISIGDFYA